MLFGRCRALAAAVGCCLAVSICSTSAHLLDCSSSPDNLLTFSEGLQAWPVGENVVLDGFVASGEDHRITLRLQGHVTIDGIRGDAADVVVVLPDDVDITFFRNEFVRVQGVASVVSDAPVLVLREGDEVVVDERGDEITRFYIRPGHPNDGNEGNEGNEGNAPTPPPASNPTPSTPSSPPTSPPPGSNVDVLGDEITRFYIRPGHPNDGNEGNEGNEGNTPTPPPPSNPTPSTPSSPPTSPPAGSNVDALGDEITRFYIRPGHPNDGNEGNEGNEGASTVTPSTPPNPPSNPPPSPAPSSGVAGAQCSVLGINRSNGASKGKWGSVIKFPLIPVASAMLPDGKVLTWSAATADGFRGGVSGETKYAVFNPNSNSVSGLKTVNTQHDMFCPGVSLLPNGDILVAGGAQSDGAGSTSVFTNGKFVKKAGLNIPRGYGSSVTLSNGKVFVLGGSFSGVRSQDKKAEVYDPSTNKWKLLKAISAVPMLSDDRQGAFRTDNYGFFFAWHGNSVFHAGPSKQMNWFTNLNGQGAQKSAGTRGPTAMNGCAVMYAAEKGKILTVGGAPTFSKGDNARKGAEVITLGGSAGSNASVKKVAGPIKPRTYSMAVVLPTGHVMHFGGAAKAVEFSDDTAILDAEIWDPATEKWSLDAKSKVPRTYHSSAVLLQDGRVFVGGGGLCGNRCKGPNVNHLDAEVYSPPYLFTKSGGAAQRPSISLNKGSASAGNKITVKSSEPLAMVTMVRMSGSTHSTNTDQRRIELCGPNVGTKCCGNTATVSVPSKGVATPGNWMMFAVNAAGVPSVAATFKVNN